MLGIEIEQIAHTPHGQLVVFVFERREGVLEHVRGMCEIEERYETLVDAIDVVGPAREHRVLDFFDELLLESRVAERMRGHVEQEEVLLLRAAHALLYQTLRQTFAHVPQLISQLQRIPRLTFNNNNKNKYNIIISSL